MRKEIEWLDDALAVKDINLAMTHYRVKDKFLSAGNGRITAGYPCDIDGEFLVPGHDLKNIYKRLNGEPKIQITDGHVSLRAGRFHGTMEILSSDHWRHGSELDGDVDWKPIPKQLFPILKDLRPFLSDNAVHLWSMAVAIDDGWCYASNNIALVGAHCPQVAGIHALLPIWAIDFILERSENLRSWTLTDYYIAFRWSNGAWMRSNLIDSTFPEKAGTMIRQTPNELTQPISQDYRQAACRIAELSEDTVAIYADRVEGRTKLSTVKEELVSEVPENATHSLWGARFLGPVLEVAKEWSPSLWPQPVPFRGERVQGYIAGRTA